MYIIDINPLKILLVLPLLIVASIQLKAKVGEKPNVMMIYTDDHRYSGVHALRVQDVQTPNLDKLSDDGITFTQTYLMASFSGATCIPSRARLHTGRNLFRLKGIGHAIPGDHTTLCEGFMDAGYHDFKCIFAIENTYSFYKNAYIKFCIVNDSEVKHNPVYLL